MRTLTAVALAVAVGATIVFGQSRTEPADVGSLAAQEQQARSREQEPSQSLQTEESRWSALRSRLEALTQR